MSQSERFEIGGGENREGSPDRPVALRYPSLSLTVSETSQQLFLSLLFLVVQVRRTLNLPGCVCTAVTWSLIRLPGAEPSLIDRVGPAPLPLNELVSARTEGWKLL